HVTNIIVCDPRRNALLNEGSKSDRIDARKLSELLRANLLRSVYHGENGLRTVKELSRAYLTIGKDLTRVMNRVKAIYRGWGIPCAGKSVYHPRHREVWLRKITQASVRRRAELYVELLVVKLCSAAHAGLGDLAQPFLTMARMVDTLAGAGNAPAAIDRLDPVHDPREVFADGQISPGQFFYCAQAILSVIDGAEEIGAQQLGQLS